MTQMPGTTSAPAGLSRSSRLSRARSRIRRGVPFVLGMAAALSAVALYGMFVPGPRALTQQDVASGISRALASMTPAPPLSLRAYKAVQRGDYDGTMRYAGEAAAALLAANTGLASATDIGMVLGAQVFAMTEPLRN